MGAEINNLLASARVMRHTLPELRILELCGLSCEFDERGGLAGMAEAAVAIGQLGGGGWFLSTILRGE